MSCSKKINIKYTDAIIRNIAISVINKIKYINTNNNSIDYIVFAGRGFQFEPLLMGVKEAIHDNFTNKKTNIETISVANANSSANNKNICLFINNIINLDLYDGNFAGDPYLLSNSGNGQALNILNIGKSINDDTQKVYNLGKIDGGYKIEIKQNNDIIMIGGTKYILPRGITKGEISLFFDGEEYWIRQEGITYNLVNGVSMEGSLIFESMFPHGQAKTLSDVSIPEIQESVPTSDDAKKENEDMSIVKYTDSDTGNLSEDLNKDIESINSL